MDEFDTLEEALRSAFRDEQAGNSLYTIIKDNESAAPAYISHVPCFDHLRKQKEEQPSEGDFDMSPENYTWECAEGTLHEGNEECECVGYYPE